jgi:hypothetical protein
MAGLKHTACHVVPIDELRSQRQQRYALARDDESPSKKLEPDAFWNVSFRRASGSFVT